jgi:hypothetical protein
VSTQTVQHSPTQFIQPITDNRPDNTGSDCIPVSMQLSAGPISSREHIHSIYDDLGVHVAQKTEELVALRFLAYGLFEVLCDIRTVRPIGTLTLKLRLNLYNYEDKIQFKITALQFKCSLL